MRRFLLSFVMVFTVAFAMAINPEDIVFNGGTVDFSKDTIYVAVCSGDKLNVYIENYGGDHYGFNSSDENAPVLYYTEDDATISSVNTLVTEESIGYTYLVTDDLGRQIKVLVLGVMLPTVTPQITTEAENFSVGNTYLFTATINADELEGWWFDWSVTPQDGCIAHCIHCDDPETMITINKSGTYILKCEVSNENTTYGPCGGVATMEITVPEPTITYTYEAAPSYCENGYSQLVFPIYGTNVSELTGTYVMEFISPTRESIVGYKRDDNERAFNILELSKAAPTTYYTSIKDGNGTEIANPVITIKPSPTVTCSSSTFYQDQEYVFINENYNSEDSYRWDVIGLGEYSIVNNREESITVKFLETGDYQVSCENESNGCFGYYEYLTVSPAPVCSISGTPYPMLAQALSSIQEGETVVLNSDCSEEGAYANTSFSLDLNGHTATLNSLIVEEALTVTNGTLTAALWGHGASGTLTVDGATINTVPNPTDYMDGHKTFKWKGDIELANNGVLEVQDSAYFGGDEGFTLSIDNMSSMNLNNAIIVIPDMDADTATTLNQIRQYLPDGYTVNASENYNWDADGYLLEFSPNSDVVLQAQPDPITFTVQNSLQYDVTNNKHLLVGCAGVTNQLVITASEDVPTDVTYYISGGYGDVLIPAEVDGNTLTFTMYSSGSRIIQLEYSDTDHYLHVIPLEDINQLYYVVTGVNTPEITQPTSSYVTGKDYVFQVVSPNELLNYTWEVIDGDNNQTEYEGASATISFATVGDYTIKCVATDSETGCESGVNPITITVLEPVTYTTQPQFFCDSWWGATYDYNVTASRALTESDVILVVGEKSFRGTPSGTQITFPLQYLEAGTYDVTLLDADSTDVLVESSVTIYAPSVQEPLDEDADYELNVSYTYTVTNPVEGHEYTWEITYYGGDSNSAADAEDYVMETNDAKTTMTVTFLHSADFRVEFMDETCGIGGDMAAYVPKSYTAESQTLCASDGEYQYSVAASEKFWGDDDEFILVVGDKSFHAFGNDGDFTVDFTLSGLEAGDYDNVVMFDADSAEVLAGPTTISLLPNLTIEGSSSVAVAYVDETVAASDIFHYHIKGTSNFTGEAILSLVDISEEVGYWDALSTSKTISVEENGEFNVEGYFIADKAPSSSTPIVAFTVGRAGAQSGETSTICGLESEISNYSADFECDGQKIALESDYGKPLMDISDEVAVGDKYYCHVEGVADFSGEAYIAMVDRSAEAQWWFDVTTAASFEVTEGEPFEFNDVFEVTAQTTSTNPVFSVMIGHFGSSEGNVFQICVTDSEIEKQMACSPDATQVEFDYYAESENYTYRLDGLASNAVAGDQYTVVWEGTPTCGGWLNFSLIDRSEAANWWKEVAEWESIQIEKGVPFTINKTFTITDSVSAASEIAFFATIDGKEGYGSSICQTEFSFTQQCHNAALVGSLSVPLAYVDGSVAENDIYYYTVKGQSDFSGEVMLSLVDQSEEAGWWDMLCDGQVVTVQKDADFEFEGYFVADKATSSTTPDVRFVINRTVDATVTDTTNLCISESTFSQYGADFACDGEKLIFNGTNGNAVASLSEVAVGDVYECNIEGTADFTGEMYIALVDHSAEADWWLELAQSTAIQVVEGESFEFNGTFTVANQTASTTPEFLLMIGHGDAETGSISQVCVTNASIRKPTVYTVSDITLCEYQTIASVTVTAEPAAIFEVVSETGAVIQSFSGETSYANFNISDLTVGAYKYYIKENGAAKDSFNITVYANPTVTITTSPESICVGDEVSFIANATGNDLTYQWENSSLEIADATSETAKWQSTVAGQYPISCTVTGEGGCTASAELVFLVNPIPVVEIEGSSEVTAGEDVTYTASVTYEGESTFVYNWTGAAQGSDQTLTTTFTDEGLSNLYCEVVTREGCKGADTLEVTVSPVEINYTVADVEMCQDQEDVVATISADRSIYGRTVTVRDEQDNTYFPEYNDNNDAAFFGVSGLNLGSGTYTFRVYDNDEYKTDFNVTVNRLPSAYIECPIDPVVGDTWTPNTAMAEGLTYHWWSDNISSLDGTMSCCPTVTFTEAGTFSATLVVKDNETGCLSEGTTCEFTVEEPVSYVKVFETYYNEYGYDRDVDGTSDEWHRTGGNLGDELTEAAEEAGTLSWTPQVGDLFLLSMKGKANFSGTVLLMIADEREEVNYWAEMTPDASQFDVTEGLEFDYTTQLNIAKTVNDEGVELTTPNFQIVCRPDLSSSKEGFDNAKTLTLSLTEYSMMFSSGSQQSECEGTTMQFSYMNDYGTSYVYVARPSVAIESASEGDEFTLVWEGTPDFSGDINVALIDGSEAAAYWKEISGWSNIQVEAGVPFKVTIPITVTENAADNTNFLLCETVEVKEKVVSLSICETNFSVKKHEELPNYVKVIEVPYDEWGMDYDGDNISDNWREGISAYESLGVDTYAPVLGDHVEYSMKGIADFTGTISLGLIDEREAACYYAEFSDYNNYDVVEGEEFEINGILVVSNIQSTCNDKAVELMNPMLNVACLPNVMSTNADFSTEKIYSLSLTDYTLDFIVDDYECDGTRLMFGSAESLNSLQKSIADEITEETTFNLSWTGTPNFTGLVQAVVIDASEEFNGMVLSQPIVGIEVEANKAFTVNQDVVVSASKSSKPNYVIEIFVPYQTEGFEATAPTVDICETEFSFVKVEQQPVSVSFSQSSYEISAGGSELICLVTEGIDLSKATITYNVSSYLSVKDKNEGCVIVTDQNGVASTQQIEAVVIYNNKEYTATADIQIIEEQPNCEGTFVTFTSAEETYSGTTYYFYESSHDVEIYDASEDDTFEFEWSFTPSFSANSVSVALVDLSNNNSSSATTYFTEGSNRTQVFNFSLPEGNNEKSTYAIKTIIQSNEKIKNATLCESYFSFKKVEKPLYAKEFVTEYNYYGTDTDGDGVSDGWQSGFDEFPAAVEKSTGNVAWTPVIGDVFSLSMQGVANFTGTVNVFMVDQREAAGYWGNASEHVPGFYVVEGEPFNITDYFAVTSTGNDDVTYEPNFVVLCQPEVTSTSAGFSEFITYKLSLTNYGLSFYPSTAAGTCDGNLITTLNSGVVDITNYVDNAIETGDKVTVNWSATPDFTGELSVALVDGRNTAEDAWLFMADPITFEVTKDVAFEVSMPFDVTDTHIKPFYQMYVAVNDKEGSADVYNICSSEISVTIKKEEDIPVECDGNLIKITGQYGDNYHVDGVPTVGDVYDVELTITPNFSGELWLNVTDKSFMNSISKQQKISLVEGVTTETTISFEIIENSSADYSEGFELTKLIRPNNTEGTFYLCESNFSIKKHKELPNYVKVIEVPYDEWGEDYDGDNVSDNWREGISAYESLGVDTYAPVLGDHVEYRMKGIADFTGTISLGLIDEREEACYYAEFSDYNSYDVVEGEEFEISGTLVVSNIQSVCDDKAVELKNPLLNVACLPNVMSTNADFSTEKNYSLSFTDYSLVYEQKQEADCMLTITMENSNSVALAHVYENIAVGDEYYAHVTGVADFTGDVFFAFVDNSEEANWWYMLDNETRGLSVVAGDTLNFEGYFTVSNPVITSKPEIAFMVGLVDSEGLGKVANICVSSVEFVKQENTFTCEGDKLILNGAEGGALATFDEVSLGDVYTCHVEGVTDFTDEVYIALVDHSEEAGWWSEMVEPLAFNVVAGEPFVYEGTFTVTEQTKSTAPEYVVYIGHSKAEGGPISRFCITKSQIEKRDVVFTLSETEVSMIVGDKKQMAVVVSESEYPFEVAWNSTNPDVVSVENGLVSALAEGTAEVQVLVNNKVVASASVIVNCENYWVRFDNKNYEITEGDSISACLSFGECFNHVDPQFEFNPNVISLTEPSDKQSTCGTITGLMAGQTSVIVSAYANGTTYTDTAIVVVKMKANKETLISLIDEGHGIQEKVLEGTYVISPIVYNEFQETMQNANEIRDNNKATQDEIDAVANSLYVAIDAIKLIAAHQMPDPVLTTEEITVCHNRTGDAISLAEFAQTTTVNGKLQWFDESGNILESTPEIDFKTIGKLTYYVTQIGTGATAECLPSDTLPLTINIVYVAAPEMNVYEQKLCNGEELQPFVAKTTNNVVWFNADSVMVAEGNSFTPSATGTYYAYTKESVDGCVSEATIVTYMLGRKAIPTVVMKDSKTEFAVGEPIEMTAQNIDADVFSIVWTVDGITMQGEEFSISTLSEGAHTIICREIDMASGCYDSTMVEIEVKNLVVPVTAISVEPGAMELYTNEKGHFAVSFEPSHATNQRYVVTVADTSVAVVSGATVIPVGAGETTLTVSSAENGDISASVSVKVTEYVAARSISVPKIVTMAVGEITKISASVLPSNASKNKVYFMEKSDSSVVKVSADGTVVAKGEGTAVVNSYTEGGLQAVTVVYVTSNAEEITSIEVPERVAMKVGDSVSVPVKVTPTSLLIKDLEWTIEDNSVASYNDGVLKALKKGETTLSVSYKGISETVTIVVNASSAPSVTTVPQVVMNQDGTATVDLSMYVTDEGGFENLTVTPSSDDFTVTVEDGKITIRPAASSYVGTDTVSVVVTNGEGLSAEVEVPVTVQETEDKAPVVKLHEILLKEGDVVKQIDLSDIAEDDMTDWSGLKFTFSIPRNGANDQQTIMTKIMKKTQLRIVKMLSFEQDSIFVTVSDGVNTTLDTIIVYVGSIPNKAPVIAEIPVQSETDESAFGTIDLTKYVTDDYTTPAAITWTTSASENISVAVANGVASVTVLNEFWRGAEAVKFYAKDEEGAMDSTVVYYVRNVTIKTEPEVSPEQGSEIVAIWEGAPSFDIMAMRTVGVPGDSYVLMASLFGFNGSFEWTIEGAEGVSAGSLMQTVTFAEPGEYDVTLTIMSADGKYEKSLTKEKLLKVVGIDKRAPEICKGQSIELKATEGMDSYYWTSGDAKESAIVRPGETTTVAVTMKQGLFTFVDSVRVKVSVPVSLMEDSVMCEGTTFDLEAQGEYVSYTWNTGESTKSIALPDVVATYSVMTVDDMQCVSADTFNLTKVNELPAIDLGEDRTPCDGTTVTLDAGAGYEYLWSTGATSQTIDLTSNTETVWARITDANRCVNYDTVVVAFTYPYPEQIGVATFSQTTDHIILAWEKTAGVNTVKYRIERETNVTDNWEQVGDEVMFSEAGIVVDEDVNYKKRAYKYRLVTTDGCGNEAVSEVHRSMISTTTKNDNGTKTLQWCAYEPMGNVTQYLVLRGYDATKMDTVDQVPASNLYEIWNETEPQFVNDENIKYRVVFRLKNVIDETAVNTLDGQPVEGYYTKAESGPFSLALSNIAEAENNDAVEDVAFPADVVVYPSIVKDVINVLIASPKDEEFTVEVVNANGQTVKTVETGEVQSTLVQIQASNLTQGVYNVRVKAGDQMKVIKVVK